jgi:hypothetical protein
VRILLELLGAFTEFSFTQLYVSLSKGCGSFSLNCCAGSHRNLLYVFLSSRSVLSHWTALRFLFEFLCVFSPNSDSSRLLVKLLCPLSLDCCALSLRIPVRILTEFSLKPSPCRTVPIGLLRAFSSNSCARSHQTGVRVLAEGVNVFFLSAALL